MKISKDMASKFKQYMEIKEQTDKLFEELESWLRTNADMDDCGLLDFGTAKKSDGAEQEEGEYCRERRTGEDSCEGTYYWSVESSDEYVYAKYCM